jgi:hypothetical protein
MEEPLPHVFGGSQANAVVVFGDGLLAFGGVNGGCCDGGFSQDTHAVIWSSDDGHAWTIVPTGPELALGTMHAAAATRDHVVVVGTRRLPGAPGTGDVDERGAVWTSDDGLTWARVDGMPVFTTIARTGDGFIAASAEQAWPELWWSATGREWARIAAQQQLGNGRMESLLAMPGGYVAVGAASNPEAGGAIDAAAAVWWSADGRSSTRLPTDPAFASATMQSAAWSAGTLAVLGISDEGTVLWRATDRGEGWERVQVHPPPGSSLTLESVVGLEDRFILAASRRTNEESAGPRLILLTSVDGRSWQQVAEADPGEILGWTAVDGAAIGVGSAWNPVVERPVPVSWLVR